MGAFLATETGDFRVFPTGEETGAVWREAGDTAVLRDTGETGSFSDAGAPESHVQRDGRNKERS